MTFWDFANQHFILVGIMAFLLLLVIEGVITNYFNMKVQIEKQKRLSITPIKEK